MDHQGKEPAESVRGFSETAVHMMEAAGCPQMPLHFFQATSRYIPDWISLHNHYCENPNCH
jgi:hypothetical protein